MAFSRRWNPQPKPPQCKNCRRRNAITGRKDGLCANCAHYPDKAKAQREERAKAEAK